MVDISQIWESFSVGMGVWLIAYGINRVYLRFKSLVS